MADHYLSRIKFLREDYGTFQCRVNLKVTKEFYKERIELAFFVNQLYSYWHEYRGSNGVLVRQTTPMPYFGMEINFNL